MRREPCCYPMSAAHGGMIITGPNVAMVAIARIRQMIRQTVCVWGPTAARQR